MGGTDYTGYSEKPYITKEGLLEIPVSIRRMHFLDKEKMTDPINALKGVKHALEGTTQWLRFFDTSSRYGVEQLTGKLLKEGEDVLFMIHSSELMPGGSPAFSTAEDIDYLYNGMDSVWKRFSIDIYNLII